MILIYVMLALALGYCVWSLLDLRHMRKRLEKIQRDVDEVSDPADERGNGGGIGTR